MIERTEERLELCPERIAADSAYGSAEMLGWLVDERAIEPHIPVFDKSGRADGTFSREDFAVNYLLMARRRQRTTSHHIGNRQQEKMRCVQFWF
jgi:hypothetical protein